MKRLTIGVLVAAFAWSGWWFYMAGAQKAAVAQWFEDRRAEGWQASYSDIAVRGFPNRIDTTIRDILLSDPARGTGWEASFLQAFQLSYKRGHVILAFPDRQTVILPSGVYELQSDGLRASLIEDGNAILRVNAEAEVLNVSGARDLALAGLLLAFEQQAPESGIYRLGLTAEAIASDRRALPGIPADLDGVQLNALLHFDAPLSRGALEHGGIRPDRVDLRLAEYRFDDLLLRLTGDLDVDPEGRLDGQLDLQAENWRPLLGMARDAGEIPDGLARTLERALALAAGLSGRRDTLDLPLDFDRGRMALGPIPLGEGPRLRLP